MSAARRVLGQVYVQVLIAVAIGTVVGVLFPHVGAQLQPIVVGIARMGDLHEVGRIGFKALVYFEVLSSVALVIGLVVVNLLAPGAGMNIYPATLDGSAIAGFAATAREQGISAFLLDIIPTTLLDAFAKGAMLQVILVSVLMGAAMSTLGEKSRPLVELLDQFLQVLFKIVGMVMRLAPLGAGAGVAFTIGKYGVGTLWSLGQLLIALYATSLLFVFGVLGQVMRLAGLPFWPFLRYFATEIFVVLGTCSTEAVLPRVMQKLDDLGCSKPVVGLVLPAGYTFNADGTCIYLTIATVFVAQATNTHLAIADQVLILGVLLLTSKGSAGVAGAGFVTLAATLSTLHAVPVTGLVLLLGVDRFLNEARAVTNLIGNSVATVAIARWDGALDLERARAILGRAPAPRVPGVVVLALCAVFFAAPMVAKAAADPCLLFQVSGDKGLMADVAQGEAQPNFADKVKIKVDPTHGHYIEAGGEQVLSWLAPGNIYAQRGTLSFYWRAREPIGPTPFPLFRVGYADHTSWDMVWLRMDWNGKGFDAFVTDSNLARMRVSYSIPELPRPDQWTHLALSWDETTGIRLYVNGVLAARKDAVAVIDSGLDQFGPHSRIVSPHQVQSAYSYLRGGDLDEIRIYDHAIDDAGVAALAKNESPNAGAAPARDLTADRWKNEWWLRYGWNRANDPAPYLADSATRIRKVEFTDARDLEERM